VRERPRLALSVNEPAATSWAVSYSAMLPAEALAGTAPRAASAKAMMAPPRTLRPPANVLVPVSYTHLTLPTSP
jgi:hypothetical protein